MKNHDISINLLSVEHEQVLTIRRSEYISSNIGTVARKQKKNESKSTV